MRGKHKPTWTPHIDTGDGVVVINAAKVRVTGLKLSKKMYQRYSGYPGGLKKESLEKLLVRKPVAVLERAITGMIPHNPLGRQMLRRLKVYPDARHPHTGQTARAKTPAAVGATTS